jgi:hypothetical protein
MPIKKKTALLGSLFAAAAISLAAGAAEARHGGGGGWGGGGGHWHGGGGQWGGMAVRPHAFSGGRNFAFRHHHRHARVFAFAPYYYDDGYAYGDGCYWLKRRALYTGSRYWWNRYYGCVNGYY